MPETLDQKSIILVARTEGLGEIGEEKGSMCMHYSERSVDTSWICLLSEMTRDAQLFEFQKSIVPSPGPNQASTNKERDRQTSRNQQQSISKAQCHFF